MSASAAARRAVEARQSDSRGEALMTMPSGSPGARPAPSYSAVMQLIVKLDFTRQLIGR